MSKARQISRVLVWVTFLCVGGYRLFVFEPPPPEPPRWRQNAGQFADEPWRRRRMPTRVQPPVAKVPADLPRFQIQISDPGMARLRDSYWRRHEADADDRPQAMATVLEGDQVYTNVAVWLKGAAGSFRPVDDKPAMTLHFSKNAPGQTFRGLTKISLNNSVQDSSFLNEIISRELFSAAGVPVPRADHATVVLNGRDLGLYVMVEGYNKNFLKRHFKNVDGNFYDGGFCQDINSGLEVDSGKNPANKSEIDALAAASMIHDPDERWKRLTETLDIDRFLSLLAMEMLTCHWDGYALNRNNYRLFHDLDSRRVVFMPHGLDQMFGTRRSSPQAPILPPMEGLVAHAVVSTPLGLKRFIQRVEFLSTNVLRQAALSNRVVEVTRRIQPTLTAYGPDVASYQVREAADLIQRIGERVQSVAEQLATPHEPIAFDEAGQAVLTNWVPRLNFEGADARYATLQDASNGTALLVIRSGTNSANPSWRARAMLGPGKYRFHGEACANGTGGQNEVYLRIAGVRPGPLRLADGQWTPLTLPFIVNDPLIEVEFICEFRGASGEVRFRGNSLRLSK